jgi:hypothetical protein
MASAAAVLAAPAFAGLAALADPALFEVEYDAVAAAIADRFTLKPHYNIAELQAGYADWITRAGAAEGEQDDRHFAGIVALLIASLAPRKAVSYSLKARPQAPHDRRLQLVFGFPNQLTALLFGAAVYGSAVTRLTGADPSVPLSGLILENAIILLRRNPESAAARFRELLQLAIPWT